MKRFVSLAVATLAFAACQDASAPDAARPTAPFSVNAARSGPIPGDYIVTLRDDVGDVGSVAQSIAGVHNGQIKHLYRSALRGFAIRNVPDAVAAAIANDPRVLRVEQDQEFHIVTTTPNPQPNPPSWGLDRIDQRSWATPSHSYAFARREQCHCLHHRWGSTPTISKAGPNSVSMRSAPAPMDLIAMVTAPTCPEPSAVQPTASPRM